MKWNHNGPDFDPSQLALAGMLAFVVYFGAQIIVIALSGGFEAIRILVEHFR